MIIRNKYFNIYELNIKPLEVREAKNSTLLLKIDKLGFYHQNLDEANALIRLVNAIELGRIVARDIGGSDPERMSAQNVASYVTDVLNSTNIKVNVIEGQETFEREYPLFAAVNRAANSMYFLLF
jgi:leucyl aminopeptidase